MKKKQQKPSVKWIFNKDWDNFKALYKEVQDVKFKLFWKTKLEKNGK